MDIKKEAKVWVIQKNTGAEEKLAQKKEEREKETKENNITYKMIQIAQIRKLSLWIFFIPFLSINICLLISVNFDILENTIFSVDQIGRSNFTIPYFDGSLSISRASRTFPQYLVFKPAMIFTSIVLILYWIKTNNLIKFFLNSDKNFIFRTLGIISAVFLTVHSILLGIEFEIGIIKLFKRIFLIGFILAEITAQASLIFHFYKVREKISNYYYPKVLYLKILLISLLILIALITIPFLANETNVNLKHGLEWNYFLGIITFYLLTFFFWKEEGST